MITLFGKMMKREKPHFPGGKNSALWNIREADLQVPGASRSGSPDRGRTRPATEHCCLRSACVGGRGLRQSPLPMRLTGTASSQSAFRTGAEKTSPCAGFSQVAAASQSRVVFASDCGLPSERRMPQAGLLRRAKAPSAARASHAGALQGSAEQPPGSFNAERPVPRRSRGCPSVTKRPRTTCAEDRCRPALPRRVRGPPARKSSAGKDGQAAPCVKPSQGCRS